MGYSKDADQNETYDFDASHNVIIHDNRYAVDKNDNEYYPKNPADGNEIKPPSLDYIVKNTEVILPLNAQGKPIYPTDNNNNQVYPNIGGMVILGRGIDGHQYYALDKNGNEFFPDNGLVALYDDGVKRYPVDSTANTVFPKDKQDNEYYLTEVNLCDTRTIPTKYAKDIEKNEIYPKTITSDGYLSDCIILDKYAKDKNDENFYPKDAFGNEFYLPEKTAANNRRLVTEMCTKRYAQTNDAKIIIPSIDNIATTNNSFTTAANTDVTGRLIREGNQVSDFLTKKDGDTALKLQNLINYKYRDLRNVIQTTNFPNAVLPKSAPQKAIVAPISTSVVSPISTSIVSPFYKTWSFWILVTISLIIKSFAIWWFLFKNKTSFINTS